MEYLSPDQIRTRSSACRAEMEALLAARAVAGKPKARQWWFCRDAVERLLSGGGSSEFDALSRTQAAQLKFEVEDKLRRFYLRPGHAPEVVFTLARSSEVAQYGLEDGGKYPVLVGYCLLVRDLSEDRVGEAPGNREDTAPYLEKVVGACIDAEFAAYAALPEIRLGEAERWFHQEGPAYADVRNLVTRHHKRGWVISNPMNPSTKMLLDIRVKKIEGAEATVSTTEYWYLRWWGTRENTYVYIKAGMKAARVPRRWWGTRENTYVYPYRETNHQTCVLRREPDGWPR